MYAAAYFAPRYDAVRYFAVAFHTSDIWYQADQRQVEMAQLLKQSTAYTFQLGPFVDFTSTPKASLTIAATDVDVSKNGAAFTDKNDATALTGTGDSQGYYDCVLDTTDTGTPGKLEVRCSVAGALPVLRVFQVVPAHVYDGLVAGSDYLQVDTQQVLGTTTTATLDSLSSQISTIGSGTGAALNFAVSEDNASAPIKTVTAVGTQTGTYANTLADDGTLHQIASVGNAIDWVYGFSCGAAKSASKFVSRASLDATGDTVTVQAYNFVTPGWDIRTTITGTAETLRDVPLLSSHTGTSGADAGKVYIRFTFSEADAGLLRIDEAYVQAQQSGSLVGYLEGLVWIDATLGSAGTIPYVNGTADNPCTTIADAYAIATAVGLAGLHIAAGTTVTLTQSADKWTIKGPGRVALGGQSIADALFDGLYTISGLSTGDDVIFEDCGIGDATIYHAYFHRCRMKGTLTLAASQTYFFDRCFDANESSSVQVLEFAASALVMLRDYRGGIQLNAMASTNEFIIDGAGRVVLSDTSVGGSITIRGFFPPITGGTGLHTAAEFITHGGTINQTVRYAADVINTEADTALADYDAPTATEMTNAFTEIKGTTWSAATDTLELIRDKETDIETDTQDLQTQVGTDGAGLTALPWNSAWDAEVNAEVVDVLRTDTLPDDYAAHEAQPTIAEAILAIHQFLFERSVSGTTVTVQKPDGTTTAMTLTLDDGTNPTSVHRSA